VKKTSTHLVKIKLVATHELPTGSLWKQLQHTHETKDIYENQAPSWHKYE